MSEVFAHIQSERNVKANEWILYWLRRLKPSARVLDFASGDGRHALAADKLGLSSYAWDRDPTALSHVKLQSSGRVKTLRTDLELDAWPAADPRSEHSTFQKPDAETNACGRERGFDAVIVSNYLFRPRMSFLPTLLSGQGLLIYQTFAVGQESLGRPRRGDFLLRPGELFEWASLASMHVLAYEDGVVLSEKGEPKARVQRLVAAKLGDSKEQILNLTAWPVKI